MDEQQNLLNPSINERDNLVSEDKELEVLQNDNIVNLTITEEDDEGDTTSNLSNVTIEDASIKKKLNLDFNPASKSKLEF